MVEKQGSVSSLRNFVDCFDEESVIVPNAMTRNEGWIEMTFSGIEEVSFKTDETKSNRSFLNNR